MTLLGRIIQQVLKRWLKMMPTMVQTYEMVHTLFVSTKHNYENIQMNQPLFQNNRLESPSLPCVFCSWTGLP